MEPVKRKLISSNTQGKIKRKDIKFAVQAAVKAVHIQKNDKSEWIVSREKGSAKTFSTKTKAISYAQEVANESRIESLIMHEANGKITFLNHAN